AAAAPAAEANPTQVDAATGAHQPQLREQPPAREAAGPEPDKLRPSARGGGGDLDLAAEIAGVERVAEPRLGKAPERQAHASLDAFDRIVDRHELEALRPEAARKLLGRRLPRPAQGE